MAVGERLIRDFGRDSVSDLAHTFFLLRKRAFEFQRFRTKYEEGVLLKKVSERVRGGSEFST